jgi:hypothetical protein
MGLDEMQLAHIIHFSFRCLNALRSGKMGEIEGAEERSAATEAARQTQRKSGTWQKDNKEL